MKYEEAMQEVLNHNGCEFYDFLIGFQYKETKRKFAFYGRLQLAIKILKGDWTSGVLNFPTGATIGRALLLAAKNLDDKKE